MQKVSRRSALVLLAAAAALTGGRAQALRGPGAHPVQVIASTDDHLCRPFAAALQRFNAGYRNKVDPLGDAPELFRKIGVSNPPLLEDGRHENLVSDPSGLVPGVMFYKLDLTGDGRPRIVLQRDYVSAHLGEYATDLWVLKPGADYRAVEHRGDEFPNPDDVDIALDFSRFETGEPAYRRPAQRPLILSPAPRANSGAHADVQPSIEGSPQRIFRFDSRYMVFAGGIDTYAAIYRLDEKMEVSVVCAFQTRPKRLHYVD